MGIHSRGIYSDLMQELVNQGIEVYVVYGREKRTQEDTQYYQQDGIHYLGVKIGNISKNKNLIEKALATLTLDSLFLRAIKKHLNGVDFDLVMYSTPPITFLKTVKYFKMRNNKTYLMLKDIFPQNAVDLNMMRKGGVIHRYFQYKERKMYEYSDIIGVMSAANEEYIVRNNSTLRNKVELFPNTIKPNYDVLPLNRKDFGLDDSDFVLLYGGNLSFPQDVPFIISCLKSLENDLRMPDAKVVICGNGSKFDLLQNYVKNENPQKTILMNHLPVDKYQTLVSLSDVGLIFLDHRFEIPNYPQRVLSYLAARKPILLATDCNTDVGSDAVNNGYGYSVESVDSSVWLEEVYRLYSNKSVTMEMGEVGYQYLLDNFTVARSTSIIQNHLNMSDD